MSERARLYFGWAALAGYLGTIVWANLALLTYGLVPVGFGLLAPAGVYFAGLAFTLRDLAQDLTSRPAIFLAIVAGALLSAIMSPTLALASGAAFLFSEGADFLVYTPLRERRWLLAVFLSNLVGLALDSVIFLTLAFGSLEFLPGQLLGKLSMTLLAVVGLALWRHLRSTSPAPSMPPSWPSPDPTSES